MNSFVTRNAFNSFKTFSIWKTHLKLDKKQENAIKDTCFEKTRRNNFRSNIRETVLKIIHVWYYS